MLSKAGESSRSGSVHMLYDIKKIPEYSHKQESDDLRRHRLVHIGEEEMNIDMDLVQPYRKIIQHAGIIIVPV